MDGFDYLFGTVHMNTVTNLFYLYIYLTKYIDKQKVKNVPHCATVYFKGF